MSAVVIAQPWWQMDAVISAADTTDMVGDGFTIIKGGGVTVLTL